MKYLLQYWSQVAVILGLIGYILKVILDYRIRQKELRNKYFYELKAKKVIELHSKIVEIQMILDRWKSQEKFSNAIFERRIDLDKFFWESELYFSSNTQKVFRAFLENLKLFESKQVLQEHPGIESSIEQINRSLLKEFKNELL